MDIAPAGRVNAVLHLRSAGRAGYSGGDIHALEVCNWWNRLGLARCVIRFGVATGRSIRLLVDDSASTVRVDKTYPRRIRNFPRKEGVDKASMTEYSIWTFGILYAIRLAEVLVTWPWWSGAPWQIAASHYPADVLPLLLRRRSSQAVVYMHHLLSLNSERVGVRRWLPRVWEPLVVWWITRDDICVLTGCDEVREFLVARGVRDTRVSMTKNAPFFKTESGSQRPRKFPGLREGDRTALFLGRFSMQKGISDLVPIAASFANREGWRLVVAGGDYAELPGELRDSPNCVWVGRVTEAEKRFLYEVCDVFVAPSREEGWGMAIAEALSCGCEVVAYELSAVRAAHGEAIRYVSCFDVVSFVAEVAAAMDGRGKVQNRSATPVEWDDIALLDLKLIGFHGEDYSFEPTLPGRGADR